MKKLWIAGGCFWGVQAYFKQIKGIVATEVGYLNGPSNKASYQDVCNNSGHTEVVQLHYKGETISLSEIFSLYIRIIDPFTLNKQGNDIGIQYRTGLYTQEQETLVALKTLLQKWEQKNGKSAIEIALVKNYVTAEKEHQDYLTKNPQGYCHINLTNIPKQFKK